MTQEYTKSASASGMSAYELGIGRKSQADLLSYSRKTARKHIQISVQKNIAKEYVQGPEHICRIPDDKETIRRSKEQKQEMGFKANLNIIESLSTTNCSYHKKNTFQLNNLISSLNWKVVKPALNVYSPSV